MTERLFVYYLTLSASRHSKKCNFGSEHDWGCEYGFMTNVKCKLLEVLSSSDMSLFYAKNA